MRSNRWSKSFLVKSDLMKNLSGYGRRAAKRYMRIFRHSPFFVTSLVRGFFGGSNGPSASCLWPTGLAKRQFLSCCRLSWTATGPLTLLRTEACLAGHQNCKKKTSVGTNSCHGTLNFPWRLLTLQIFTPTSTLLVLYLSEEVTPVLT